MSLAGYFDRVFIINLPHRIDRRREMTAELERAGLPPREGRVEFFPAVKVDDAAGFENAGYHGCFRSHLEILRKARELNTQHLLVLEDDAALSPHFKRDEARLAAQMQAQPWGVIVLGYADPSFPSDGAARLAPFPGKIMGSHFYAVHRSVLDRMIDALEWMLRRPPGHPDGGPMSPDGAINFFLGRNPDIPAFIVSPCFGGQRASRSDILPHWIDRLPVIRQMAGVLRRAKRSLARR